MPKLGSSNFELGWIPSEDAVRGRANGLVRMDNLNLDEDGVVSLTRGTTKASVLLNAPPVNLFSKEFSGVKHRYAGLFDNSVVKDIAEAGTFDTSVLIDGSIDTAYGATLGQVLICSGDQKKKDDGTYIRNLGIPTPDAPTIAINEKYSLDVWNPSELTVEEGTLTAQSDQILDITADSDSFRIVAKSGAKDLTAIQGGVSGTESKNDQFTLWFKPYDSTRTKRVRIEFLLEIPSGTDEHVSNYYFYEWDFFRNLELLNKGIDQDVGLVVERNAFQKVGFDSTLGWEDVRVIRIIIENATVQDVGIKNLIVEGGRGTLTGTYTYLQVNVFNNGKYEARSVAGDATDNQILDHQFTKVTPDSPTGFATVGHVDETNKIYIYRRNEDIGGNYTLIAIREDTSEFIDNVSDEDAVNGIPGSNIDNIIANLFLESIPNGVVDLVANYFRRTIYITVDRIAISDIDNPDAVDSRIALDTSGESSEVNLWSIKEIERAHV